MGCIQSNAIFHFHTMGLGAALKSSWPILSREWNEVFVLIITRKGEQAAKASAAAALFFDKAFLQKTMHKNNNQTMVEINLTQLLSDEECIKVLSRKKEKICKGSISNLLLR